MNRTMRHWRWALGAYSLVELVVAGFVAWDWQTHDPFNATFSGIWLFLVAPHADLLVSVLAGDLTGAAYLVAVVLVALGINALAYPLLRAREMA
ncbi:MAG: hypothetical protein ACRDWY_18290 [Actinomycetes bacterium]